MAPDALLDTYDAERHAIGERVLKTSDRLLRSLLIRNRAVRGLRELAFRALIPRSSVQEAIAGNLSGLGVAYETGHGAWAGRRVPDMEIMSAEHERVRFYEIMRGPGYVALVFIDPDQAVERRDAIAEITSHRDDALRTIVLLNNGLPELHDLGAETFVDYQGDFETKIGVRTGRIVLVRPDGYVAFDLDTLDPDAFAARLETWKTRRPLFSVVPPIEIDRRVAVG